METITKSTRDLKQLDIVTAWIIAEAKGTLVAATGFGKSIVGKLIIEEVDRVRDNAKVLLVVPFVELKNQWELNLKKWKLDKWVEVLVVNTACKNNYECDLLVVDRILSTLKPLN